MELDRALGALASGQHGLLTRHQAERMGASPAAIRRRLEDGRWQALHPGVYLVTGAPRTHKQTLMAAVLAGGRSAAVSHESAASMWRLPRLGGPRVEIVVPRPRHPRLDGVTVHQARVLGGEDITLFEAIPVTSPARTLVDLAARAGRLRLALAVDDALARGLVTVEGLADTAARVAVLGRPGGRRLRQILAERDPAGAPPESVLESRFLDVLRRAGLPLPVCQHPVSHEGRVVASIDFAYPDLRLGIEADGWAVHGGREAFELDRERANLLAAIGWVLLRVTWRQLTRQPDAVVATVRAALRTARRAQVAPSTAA